VGLVKINYLNIVGGENRPAAKKMRNKRRKKEKEEREGEGSGERKRRRR